MGAVDWDNEAMALKQADADAEDRRLTRAVVELEGRDAISLLLIRLAPPETPVLEVDKIGDRWYREIDRLWNPSDQPDPESKEVDHGHEPGPRAHGADPGRPGGETATAG